MCLTSVEHCVCVNIQNCSALHQKATCSFLTQCRAKCKAKMSGSHDTTQKLKKKKPCLQVYLSGKNTLKD